MPLEGLIFNLYDKPIKMKTNLPTAITTIEEAKAFLTELHTNGEHYHPEDDAHDILWDINNTPNRDECMQLNELMHQIYALPGNDGRHSAPLAFDPCLFLIILDHEYSNAELQTAVKAGTLNPASNYQYCIQSNPDPYRQFWTMDIINDADCIEHTFVYFDMADAEADAELLSHIFSMEEC